MFKNDNNVSHFFSQFIIINRKIFLLNKKGNIMRKRIKKYFDIIFLLTQEK